MGVELNRSCRVSIRDTSSPALMYEDLYPFVFCLLSLILHKVASFFLPVCELAGSQELLPLLLGLLSKLNSGTSALDICCSAFLSF